MSPTGTAVFVLATTGAYSLSRVAAKRFPSPFTTPVFFGTAVVMNHRYTHTLGRTSKGARARSNGT